MTPRPYLTVCFLVALVSMSVDVSAQESTTADTEAAEKAAETADEDASESSAEDVDEAAPPEDEAVVGDEEVELLLFLFVHPFFIFGFALEDLLPFDVGDDSLHAFSL